MTPSAKKVVLVPDPRRTRGAAGIRRFRLARLAASPARDGGAGRFAYLKHVYD